MAQVKIKKLDPNATIPTSGSAFAAGYDLYACLSGDGEVTIPAHHTVMVPTGHRPWRCPRAPSAACLPAADWRAARGCVPQTASALWTATTAANALSPSTTMRRSRAPSAPGERIAQLVLLPYLPIEFDEVTDLPETARGEGGFGSTGR